MEQNKLIPMSDIRDEVRQIAVAWAETNKCDWIGDKHKLASDIQKYSDTFADQKVALNGEWNRVEDVAIPNGSNIEVWNTLWDMPQIWFDFYNDESKYPFEYWKPASVKPGSNQGPTKVQLIETIAQLQKDNDELRHKVALHAEELGNQNSYAGMDMENRHDKAMAFLVERITAQKDIAVAMMGDGANQAVIAYNYSIAMITGVTLDDF